MVKAIHKDDFVEPVLTTEEQQIENDFEAGFYKSVPNMENRIEKLQKIATHSIKKKTTTAISMRRDNELLEKVKEEAAREHLPYQTYIKRLVYKHFGLLN